MTRYLSADNVEELSSADVAEYPLPYDPETLVRIRSVSMSRMKEFQETQAKGGSVARRAESSLIAESVVGPDDQPVWKTAESVERLGKSKTRLVKALVQMINKHNGGDDELVETIEKNSGETS